LRNQVSRKKFFNGLYAEYSGLVLTDNGYIDSVLFIDMLNAAKQYIDDEPDNEHALYTLGKAFLARKKNDAYLDAIKDKLGSDWKALRFQHLVRLGADIHKVGLSSLTRATLVGVLLFQKEKLFKPVK